MSNVKRIVKYPVALIRTAIIIINNIYCIPTYVIWMTCLWPFKIVYPGFYSKVEGILFSWLLAVVAMWSYSAGYDIVEGGDDISCCMNKHTLVLANHQSTADVPLLMANFTSKPKIVPNVMWIMDRLFKFTNFGIVSIIHEDFFISSGRAKRDASIQDLKDHLENSYKKNDRKWIILFPEGGFLRKRKHISQRYAEQHGLPHLEHVTLPRIGAMKAVIDVLQKDNNDKDKQHCLDYVLDITIAYPDGVPLGLLDIVSGLKDPCQTYMHYRVYKVTDVPSEEASLTEWLYELFYDKENILKNFYETGLSDALKLSSQIIRQDIIRLFLINVFFITSSYIHYQIFRIIIMQYFFISRVYIQVS